MAGPPLPHSTCRMHSGRGVCSLKLLRDPGSVYVPPQHNLQGQGERMQKTTHWLLNCPSRSNTCHFYSQFHWPKQVAQQLLTSKGVQRAINPALLCVSFRVGEYSRGLLWLERSGKALQTANCRTRIWTLSFRKPTPSYWARLPGWILSGLWHKRQFMHHRYRRLRLADWAIGSQCIAKV